jgi:hypothetical protein
MHATTSGSDWLTGLTKLSVAPLLILAVVAIPCLMVTGAPYVTMHFFRTQDVPAIAVVALAALAVRWALASTPAIARLTQLMDACEPVPVWVPAALAGVASLAGTWLIFGRYPLSMDEFWARTDGTILLTGRPLAHIPAEWSPYAPAMQPIFLRLLPDQGLWASAYLPVNGAVQGLLGPMAGPLLAAFSVLVAADLARRLLPQHPTAPIVCALLMASSSQLLLTAMTPYAMTAHLAFNLAWLWLFLRRSRFAQVCAVPIAMLAIGLHQVVFFPMFALPFLLEAFLAGRRGAAIVHGVAIAAAFLFWSSYDAVLYWMYDAIPPAAGPTGSVLLFDRMLGLVANFDLSNIGLMALNLLRWELWQNVLAVPLLLTVALPVLRTPGPWRPMVGGIVLTIVVMTIVLAFQGHGWGYRYLHGLLGNLCLLATYAWFRLKDQLGARRELRALFAAALALSVAFMPFRAWQAERFAAPYRHANEAIDRIDADVVLIDAPKHIYAADLIRNDPFLTNRPIRMTPVLLSDAQLTSICSEYRVAYFNDADAERFGLPEPRGATDPVRVLPASCRGKAE